jgi:prepilin-type N-terminal cleavage/methylation domain-containing protein
MKPPHFTRFESFPASSYRGLAGFGSIEAGPRRGISGKPSAALRSGFTLTEILVVITIIVMLALVLLMVSKSIRSSAYKVRELNNLRNITVGVINYHAERQVLPGPCFRGLPVPSKIPDAERAQWLPTILIDAELMHENDDTFFTFTDIPESQRYVTYVCNNSGYTIPTRFFGYPRESAQRGRPKALSALRSNKTPDRGGVESQSIHQLWMLCTADKGMYSNHPSIRFPALGYSNWKGRFYSYFDGRVEFIPKRDPSIYPSIDLYEN